MQSGLSERYGQTASFLSYDVLGQRQRDTHLARDPLPEGVNLWKEKSNSSDSLSKSRAPCKPSAAPRSCGVQLRPEHRLSPGTAPVLTGSARGLEERTNTERQPPVRLACTGRTRKDDPEERGKAQSDGGERRAERLPPGRPRHGKGEPPGRTRPAHAGAGGHPSPGSRPPGGRPRGSPVPALPALLRSRGGRARGGGGAGGGGQSPAVGPRGRAGRSSAAPAATNDRDETAGRRPGAAPSPPRPEAPAGPGQPDGAARRRAGEAATGRRGGGGSGGGAGRAARRAHLELHLRVHLEQRGHGGGGRVRVSLWRGAALPPAPPPASPPPELTSRGAPANAARAPPPA